MTNMDEQNQNNFSLENFPEDAIALTGQTKVYSPIDAGEIYQVQLTNVTFKQNPYWKPADLTKGEKENILSKYQLSFEFSIINEGPFYGRKLWDNAYLSLKPTTKGGKGGPTKLYKILSKALKMNMDGQACTDFSPDAKTLFANVLKHAKDKQLRVSIENTEKDGKVRSKIVAYNEAKDSLPPFDLTKVARS